MSAPPPPGQGYQGNPAMAGPPRPQYPPPQGFAPPPQGFAPPPNAAQRPPFTPPIGQGFAPPPMGQGSVPPPLFNQRPPPPAGSSPASPMGQGFPAVPPGARPPTGFPPQGMPPPMGGQRPPMAPAASSPSSVAPPSMPPTSTPQFSQPPMAQMTAQVAGMAITTPPIQTQPPSQPMAQTSPSIYQAPVITAPSTSKPRRVYAEQLASPSTQAPPQPIPQSQAVPQGYGQPAYQPQQPPQFGQPLNQPQQPYQPTPPSGFLPPSQMSPMAPGPQNIQPMQQQQPPSQPLQQHPPEPPKRMVGKSKIDPNNIPSPISVRLNDQGAFMNQVYGTCSKQIPPMVTTECRTVDEGNSQPAFVRMTSYSIPCSNDVVKTSDIPLGMVVQPLADPRDGSFVPIVDFGERELVRCQRCKAYMNPFMLFVDGGRTFVCNLCGMKNGVPDFYFANLDLHGKRIDYRQRPELCLGTVEFNAPADYSQRPPKPAAYVFVLDVSVHSKQTGLIQVCAEAIKEVIREVPRPRGLETTPIDVGLITFDRTVHFYNLSASLSQAQMLVVPELDDMFVPLETGFLVNPDDSLELIDSLLNQIPTTFKDTVVSENVAGAAIQAAALSLKNRGGRVFVFQSCLPNSGPGVLRPRDDASVLGTDKEKTLFMPQDSFYTKLGQECVENGVCVDLFLAPTGYIDVASMGALSSMTGGHTYFYPRFQAAKHKDTLTHELKRSVGKVFGFDAVMRVRTCSGLRVKEYYGNIMSKNETDIAVAGVDGESAMGVQFQHEGTVDEKSDVSFQCAILYTTMFGQRRIRVINISLPASPLIANYFKLAEIDVIMALLAKSALHQVSSSTLAKIRSEIIKKTTNILFAYRKHCAVASSPGQLVLPESLKLLPVLVSALVKNPAFRAGSGVTLDEKVYSMRLLKGASVEAIVPMIYPRLFGLHDISEEVGQRNEAGQLIKPNFVRVAYERLNPHGVYLAENGRKLYLWIGQSVPTKLLQDLFGTGFIESIDTTQTTLLPLNNPLSKQVTLILEQIREANRLRYLPLEFVRQREPIEALFHENVMMEDKSATDMSYVDHIMYVHREIQNALSE